MTNLKVSLFHPDEIKKNFLMVIIGKRRSGKTVLLRDLMYRHRHRFDYIVALTNTDASKEAFQQYIPKSCIKPVHVQHVIETVEMARTLRERGTPREILIIMDDCLGGEKKIFYNKIFDDIAYNGRNFNISLVISLQYCMEMPTNLRSQIDYCFAFQETNRANKKRLFEYFFGVFDDLKSFDKTLCQCTVNYEALILDTTVNTGNLSDQIFYYRASMNIPPFRLGRSIYWTLDDKYRRRNNQSSSRNKNMSLINKVENTIAARRNAGKKPGDQLIVEKA
jgi:hypothetical protein